MVSETSTHLPLAVMNHYIAAIIDRLQPARSISAIAFTDHSADFLKGVHPGYVFCPRVYLARGCSSG